MSATSEVSRKSGRIYSVRNCGKDGSYDTYGSSRNENRDPVNTSFLLVASFLAASHLPKLEWPQDDGSILEE